MQWTVVIPLKPLERAKSRLAPAAGDGLRPALALAFAQDTVAAAVACPAVRDVVVVTDDVRASRELAALGARVVPDTPGDGLNAALAHAAHQVRSWHPEAPVAALNADLPALRPRELARVLDAAAPFPRAFLADAAGIGTTLLTAAPGTELRPQFGGPSRARHRDSGAVELGSGQAGAAGVTGAAGAAGATTDIGRAGSVRQDVDTGDDLRAALALGVGPHTAAAAAGLLIPD
ncbi:2-phospho-L-lactate guanylyltransferase [Streptomyces flavofungini]|uniref:2-phospho-L-lactate guanylyltransferase n=1 Tax=Streptomyces flavofungini TaxID=68200 RepID=UPI0019981400|nr:2-phospho-L-lactate guanylyltransferase [Streptomyces flavofungini]GHC84896.1 2-phospho-L-lactate guanylyltransferase [Streptomyces flavofungini]